MCLQIIYVGFKEDDNTAWIEGSSTAAPGQTGPGPIHSLRYATALQRERRQRKPWIRFKPTRKP